MHVEKHGSGEPLLLIHGWGMHGGMWGGVVEKLAEEFCVYMVDLPGHGQSTFPSPFGRGIKGEGVDVQSSSTLTKQSLTPALIEQLAIRLNPQADKSLVISQGERELDAIVSALTERFPMPLTVCGWSLGGQIALRWAAREPLKIQRLILVSSTPCFVKRDDWQCAMAAEILEGFADALTENYAQTLRRFLALQVRGSDNERELLVSLRAALFSRGEPDLNALQAGLEILRDGDLRGSLPTIMQPTLVIAGERDTLTPPQASQYMAAQLLNAKLAMIKGAAHAPFLSHPEIFVEQIKSFLHERI
jgi:pimeloyl-[acyl-carrier protein] methyl ester esterase